MQQFDHTQPAVFLRNRQLFGGKPRKAGDKVPAGFSKQQLERFASAGIIGNAATQLPKDPPPKRPQDNVVGPSATQLPKDPPPATPAVLKHTGAGWYNVEVDGLGAVNDSKIKGREAAEKWAAENNYSLAVDGE